MSQLDNRQRAYLDAMGIDIWTSAQGASRPEVDVQATAVDVTPVEQQATKVAPIDVKPVAVNVDEQAHSEELTSAGLAANDLASMDWQALQNTVAACTLCDLHKTRIQTVFGVGNVNADVLVIGEAPGEDEDKQGEPFVGQAGQLLNAMLKAIGFERNDVYLANMLKCRPPQNRDPVAEEAEACAAYLKCQIELVQPKVILALGRIAAQRLLDTNTSLSRLRGKQHYMDNISIPVVVTYHPAYLLRAPQEKRKTWEDLQFLVSKL